MDVQSIRPTQFTVGMREIHYKEQKLRAKSASELKKYIEEDPIEGVLGPGGEFYATDGHHFALSAQNAGVKKVCIKVLKDYSDLPPDEFWLRLEKKGFSYLFVRGEGPYPAFLLPRRIQDMTDDPYRSLASAVKRAKGFKKSKIHYSEFQWADFFRKHIQFGPTDQDFEEAVHIGYVLAQSPLAADLPGYHVNSDESCETDLKKKK